MGWTKRWQRRLRALLQKDAVERELDEELAFHLEMEIQKNLGAGMPPEEARRQAGVAFGGVERYKEEVRDARVLGWVSGLSLDLKLGLRMLAKYPGLSLVAVIGMTVAIAIGAGFFAFIGAMLDPTLPLHEGERVVSIQNNNSRNPGNPDRHALHDFVLWRARLKSVQGVGAYTGGSRTLVVPGGSTDLVGVAQMTASGFRVARVAPVLGRPLLDEDEREGGPPVVVIAYEEWQRRFDGDPDIIGRPIRLGTSVHTVVGVMPEGFRFPVNYRFWTPLRLDPSDNEPGAGPTLHVFGRLAPGVSMEEAQAELAAIGPAPAADPEARRHLRPRVLPYTHAYTDIDSPAIAMAFRALQLAISLLLVVVAVNVSVLVYARTATRVGEIAVRTALGASRKRVVTQLFAEALVLSALSAAIGLTIAGVGLAKVGDFLERSMEDTGPSGDQLPFWFDLGLSPGVVAYVVGLALVAGVIVGVLPALKATVRNVQAGLQQLSSRGSQMQLGRMWTAMIVVQVAFAVGVLPYAAYIAGRSLRRGTAEAAYPVDEYLRAGVALEREEAPPSAGAAAYDSVRAARFVNRTEELVRRLEAEPAVAGVTFARHFPGYERYHRIEAEGGESRSVRVNQVDVDLFTVFDVPVLAGRGFVEAESREDATAVVINGALAEWLGKGGDVLGRRIRLVRRTAAGDQEQVEKGPWLEVVGVVPDFTIKTDFDSGEDALLYRPVSLSGAAAAAPSVNLALRIRGTPAPAFAGRLREISAAVDPALLVHELKTAAESQWEVQQGLLFIALWITAATLSVLLLSAAGIYAMMSFTVAQRRREIGIRSALGADPRRLLSGIFARAGAQLGAGVLGGLLLSAAVDRALGGGLLKGERLILLPLAGGLMVVVGLLAALGPARRGLAVQPSEALREE